MRRLRTTDDEVRARLPLDDPGVDELDTATRQALSHHWEARATSELRVASIFAVLARELFETGADPPVMTVCARAVSDEVRHAEICRLLAERYGDREVPWPAPGAVPMPLHSSAPERLRPTLRAVAMGCINETIASVWLDACLKDATSPLARAAIRELIADDVHHARLGWAHLGSSRVTAQVRTEVAAWLPRLLQTAALPWLEAVDDASPGFPAHGVPSAPTTLAAVEAAIRSVILPGFEALGVSIGPARTWVDGHLATFSASERDGDIAISPAPNTGK
jgi:hypothetical protein